MKRHAHACGAPGCNEAVRGGHVMCHAHWLRLPRHLRETITSAWDAGRNSDWTRAVMEARRWHADNPPVLSASLAARLIGERA